MAFKEKEKDHGSRKDLWFLDSGCSNHMCSIREWFTSFDDKFEESVQLGNGQRLAVKGKGSVKLKIRCITQIVTDVYYTGLEEQSFKH